MDYAAVTREELIEKLEAALRRIADLEAALEETQRDNSSAATNSLLQALLNATTEGALLIDRTGKILALNETQAQRLGRTVSELVGNIVYDFLPEEVVNRRKPKLEEVFRSGKHVRFEDERSGLLLDNSVYPVFDNRHGVEAIAVYANDITEHRRTERALLETCERLEETILERTSRLQTANELLRAEIAAREESERALRASEERYRTIFANAPVGIDVVDSDGRFSSFNKTFRDMLGYTEEELADLTFQDVTFPADIEPSVKYFRALISGEIPSYTMTKRYVRKDGEVITARILTCPLLDQDSESLLSIGVIEDITERTRVLKELKESRRQLQQREDLFQTFMNNSPLVAFMKDETGRYVYINRPWEEAFGKKSAEVMGKATQEIWPPESALQLMESDEAALASTEAIQFVLSLTDPAGRPIHLWVCKFSLTDPDGNRYVGGVALDITKQKEDEKALKESEEKYRLLVEAMNDGMGIADAEGVVTYVNDRFLDIIGFTREELVGRKIRDFMDPAGGTRFDEQFARRKEGQAGVYETVFVTKDGVSIPVILSAKPLFDEEGIFRGGLAVVTNISELKTTQEKLLASLRDKDVLLQEVHHRVKNNLQLILSLLRMQARTMEDPRGVEAIRDAENRVFSIALVHEKLYLSPNLSTIEIGHYVKTLTSHVVQAYQGMTPPIDIRVTGDELIFSLDTAIPIGMILTELVSNVLRHAFPSGERGELHVALHARDNNLYELIVKDNGIGLQSREYSAASKSIGLDLVKTFASQLDGKMEIESNGGTQVRVTFRDIKRSRPSLDG